MNSSTGRRNDPGNRRPEKTIAYVIIAASSIVPTI
jgi:hypothetical protein